MITALDKATEAAGRLGGWALAPAVAVATRLRGVRLLHAEGQTYTADALPDPTEPRLRPLADRLGGAALVRLSAALWRGREWPDILGLTLRFFGRPRARPEASSVQDLLLATAPGFFRLPVGFVTTDPHDFLANRYHGLGPFEAGGFGAVAVRGVWGEPSPPGHGRFDRLMSAVVTERAELSVELRPQESGTWVRLLRMRLRVPAALDERRTRFSPFNHAAGLRPKGFAHALRRAPYAAGQEARGAGAVPVAGGQRRPPTRSAR